MLIKQAAYGPVKILKNNKGKTVQIGDKAKSIM
jgi:hypothetical protein